MKYLMSCNQQCARFKHYFRIAFFSAVNKISDLLLIKDLSHWVCIYLNDDPLSMFHYVFVRKFIVSREHETVTALSFFDLMRNLFLVFY